MPKFELPKFEPVPKVDLKTIDLPDVPEVAAKPLYAGVGVTDLAVEKVKVYVTEVQTKVNARVADVQKSVKEFEVPQPKTLQGKATAQLNDTRAKFEAKLSELQADAKALPTRVQTTVKKQYDENVATLTGTYADLAKRGESVVTKLRKGDAVKAPASVPGSVAKNAPAKKTPRRRLRPRRPPPRRLRPRRLPPSELTLHVRRGPEGSTLGVSFISGR